MQASGPGGPGGPGHPGSGQGQDGQEEDENADECAPYVTRAGIRVSCVRRCAEADLDVVHLHFLDEQGVERSQQVELHRDFASEVRGAFAHVLLSYLIDLSIGGGHFRYRPIWSGEPIYHRSWKIIGGAHDMAPEKVAPAEVCQSTLSYHAHGLAIDLNAFYNSIRTRPNPNWQIEEFCPYAWRDTDELVVALERRGWDWGGHFSGDRVDYMHFGKGEGGNTPSGFTEAVCD